MKIKIPLAGECEITELKHDFYIYSEPEDDFTVIKANDSEFWLCDPNCTTAICKHLFGGDVFVQPIIDLYSPDEDFWFFARNERETMRADELPFGNIFDLYVEYGFIKEIHDERLKELTAGNVDCIYVYSPLYCKPTREFFEKLYALAKEDAEFCKNERVEWNQDCLDDDERKSILKGIQDDYEECLQKIESAYFQKAQCR